MLTVVVAAESREFTGILRRVANPTPLVGLNVQFAKRSHWKGDDWIFVANGPGPNLARVAWTEVAKRITEVEKGNKIDRMISTGFCGALDPSLRLGDVVVSVPPDSPVRSRLPFFTGAIASRDRVASSSTEKKLLWEQTGAIATEMEAQAGADCSREWNIPFQCIRVVSDTAEESLPLDFNLYRDTDGRFSRGKIARAALQRPFTLIPALLQLDKNCRFAAEKLGEFFADCN